MEEKSLDEQNNPQLESIVQPCLDGLEDDDHVSSFLDIGYDSKCSTLTVQSSTDFAEYRSLRYLGFGDLKASHIVYASTPPLNSPFNLTLSERFMGSFKLHGTRTSASHCNETFQYAAAFGQRKVFACPFEKLSDDTNETDEKVRNLSEGSAAIQLAGLRNKGTKLSNLTRSPSSIGRIPLGKLCQGYKRRSASKISDLTFISSSSSKSTCSYQSELSEFDIVSKGLLRCAWKNGLPYFEFSISDDPGQVFVANPTKIKSVNDKSLDYIYVFCSLTNARKRGCFNSIYNVIGKMKVSSHLSLDSNKAKIVETEFVLFDASEDKKRVMSSCFSSYRYNKGMPGKLLNAIKQNDTNYQNSARYDVKNLEFGELLNKHGDEISQLVETDPPGIFRSHFSPNMELCAIITKDHHHRNQVKKVVGGWGLKFLETHDGIRQDQLFNFSGSGRVEDEFGRSINVLIPAGSHGGPSNQVTGASSLVERWRTGGRCDCGGWDIGCPLTVLSQLTRATASHPSESSKENPKSVSLSTEGAKQDEPATLRLMELNEGLYALSFQSKLSALQAFSIGVATIHSQAPSLKPEL